MTGLPALIIGLLAPTSGGYREATISGPPAKPLRRAAWLPFQAG